MLIAQEEDAHWDHGMVINASAVAAISAALTAAAPREAAVARERHEVKAAAWKAAAECEARATQEAVAKKEAEMRALEQALAQERARRKADMKAQAGAAKREAIENARPKVAEQKAKTEVDIGALGAEKPWLRQQAEREAAHAHKEAERHAAEATTAAMEEAESKICHNTPQVGSRVDYSGGSSTGTPPPE